MDSPAAQFRKKLTIACSSEIKVGRLGLRVSLQINTYVKIFSYGKQPAIYPASSGKQSPIILLGLLESEGKKDVA